MGFNEAELKRKKRQAEKLAEREAVRRGQLNKKPIEPSSTFWSAYRKIYRYLILPAGILFLAVIIFSALYSEFGSSSRSESGPGGLKPTAFIKFTSEIITKEEFGDKWPFTSDEARLKCDDDDPLVEINGKKYALNGFALQKGYPYLGPVWLKNPDLPGTRISIHYVSEKAMKRCEN